MERTKELIQQEIVDISVKLDNLRKELFEKELGEIDIKGKYLFLENRNLYIHVENFWFSSRNYKDQVTIDYDMIIEGESFSGFISDYADDTFFRWEQYDQITEHLRGGIFKDYKEITKEEFEGKLDQLINEVREEIKSERQE